MNTPAISLRALAFVRDVLIPRAWVEGAEVDELVQLRTHIDEIFSSLREQQTPQPEPPSGQLPAQAPQQQEPTPRPKKKRPQQPPPPGAS